jgi:L-serine dehydratase
VIFLKDPASIFNDVIGPVMIGPSSSHTAASVRIGNLIRQMTGGRPRRVVFEFAAGSSIAETYQARERISALPEESWALIPPTHA